MKPFPNFVRCPVCAALPIMRMLHPRAHCHCDYQGHRAGAMARAALDLVRVGGKQSGQQRDGKEGERSDANDGRKGQDALVLLVDLHRRLHSLGMQGSRVSRGPPVPGSSAGPECGGSAQTHPHIALSILVHSRTELRRRRRGRLIGTDGARTGDDGRLRRQAGDERLARGERDEQESESRESSHFFVAGRWV
jgi:hypothetical protein